MKIKSQIRKRITDAATLLFDRGGRTAVPTVHAVRELAGTNNADATAVMQEWRVANRLDVTEDGIASDEHARLQDASEVILETLRSLLNDAASSANKSIEAAKAMWSDEKIRLSTAIESQGSELNVLRKQILELEFKAASLAQVAEQDRVEGGRQLASLTERANFATIRASESEQRMVILRSALDEALALKKSTLVDLEAERKHHFTTSIQLDSLSKDRATFKMRAAALETADTEQSQRLGRLEAQFMEWLINLAEVRDETAKLRGAAHAIKSKQINKIDELDASSCNEDHAVLTRETITINIELSN